MSTRMSKLKSITDNARRHRLENAELLLIRTGQHLFREWRDNGRMDEDLEASYECIWRLKREVREEKRELLAKVRLRPISEATEPLGVMS